jgi:mRNA-degrading endonuclease RelE of RelBE toxin-antitoxin system
MDKIEKLLRKISKKDRESLLGMLDLTLRGDKNLNIIKIKNTDFFRVRHGKFRIIFHKDNGEVIIDSIKFRNEDTCKKL